MVKLSSAQSNPAAIFPANSWLLTTRKPTAAAQRAQQPPPTCRRRVISKRLHGARRAPARTHEQQGVECTGVQAEGTLPRRKHLGLAPARNSERQEKNAKGQQLDQHQQPDNTIAGQAG